MESQEKAIEIVTTTGSIDEARKMARHFVEKNWVACAEIIPWIESVYRWNGHLETVQESRLFLKTKSSYKELLFAEIKKLSSYEVPLCMVIEIKEFNPEYKKWFEESLETVSQP